MPISRFVPDTFSSNSLFARDEKAAHQFAYSNLISEPHQFESKLNFAYMDGCNQIDKFSYLFRYSPKHSIYLGLINDDLSFVQFVIRIHICRKL